MHLPHLPPPWVGSGAGDIFVGTLAANPNQKKTGDFSPRPRLIHDSLQDEAEQSPSMPRLRSSVYDEETFWKTLGTIFV